MRMQKFIQKITFSALMIALGIIFSRLVAIPNFLGLSFLKVSLTNSIIMFSSIVLGFGWGTFIASAVDIVGAILIPQNGGFNIIFTIPAAVTGLMPYIFYKLLKNNKFDNKYPVSFAIILSILSSFIVFYFLNNDFVSSITGKKYYYIEPYKKSIIMCIVFIALSFIYILLFKMINKNLSEKYKSKVYSLNTIGSSVFLTYFLCKIPLSSLVKSLVLNWDFKFVFIYQFIVGFFSCLVHTFIIFIVMNVLDKYINFNERKKYEK